MTDQIECVEPVEIAQLLPGPLRLSKSLPSACAISPDCSDASFQAKQAERDYPYRIDSHYLFTKPFGEPRILREYACALEILRKHIPSGAILDLGCGPGWSSVFLARAGYEVVGVDISERMVEIAQERAEEARASAAFAVADMEELDLDRKDFDGVMIFDALHHCPAYERVLRRANSHLRPGGSLLLLEPSWLHHYSPHARQATREFGVTELGFTRHGMRRELRKAGFRQIFNYYDAGPVYSGLTGLLWANLRLWAGFLTGFPRVKQIVLAVK